MGPNERTPLQINKGNEELMEGPKVNLITKIRSSRISVVVAVSFALFTDLLVYGIIMPIIPQYVTQKFHTSSTEVGFLVASYAIGLLLLTPVFGVVSDNPKIGRRIPMVLGLFALAGSTVFFMFAWTYYWLLFARLLQGASAAASWVIGLALVADVYPPESVGSAMGIVMGANGLGILVGPVVGGFLYEYAGYRSSFILCAGLALFDMVIRLALVSDYEITKMRQEYVINMQTQTKKLSNEEEGKDILNRDRKSSILTLARDPVVLLICGCVFLGAVSLSCLEPTLPLFLHDKFRAKSGAIGIVFGAIVIPYIISSSLTGYLTAKINARILMAIGLLWVAGALVGSSYMPNIYLCAAILGVGGLGLGLIITPTLPELAAVALRRGDNNANGQIYAIFNLVYAFGSVGGPLVAGAVYEFFGFSMEMIIAGGVLCLYIPVLLIFRNNQ
eukprot:Phypoly_transcript_08167.p1 GENE.Phypoly_transcript_08167~~Phypoly_transcript_08167.p1  ORF type:complete len:446 (+),score=43.61 Phypoly_transcript_08167:185-1522(+)